MQTKFEIQWSPIKNKFISWGTDICLYETELLQDSSSSCMYINTVYINNLKIDLFSAKTIKHYWCQFGYKNYKSS